MTTLSTALGLQRCHARAAQTCRFMADNITDADQRRIWRERQLDNEQRSRMWLRSIWLCVEAEVG